MKSSRPHRSREVVAFAALAASFALGTLLAACAVELDSDTWATSYDDPGCPRWACGSNTAMVNGTAVGELNRNGAAGDGGFRILSFQHALGLSLQLDIRNGELVGTGLLGIEYRGASLIGSRIILENLTELSLHAITVTDVGHVDSWTQPVKQVPAYHLLSVTLDLDLLPIGSSDQVCGAVLPAGDGSLLARHYAVLVDDERYDPRTKSVIATGTSARGWFNIACNGSALAKMKLLGYDPEYTNTATTIWTTPAQRQATLKMLTADYCGSGKSFTVMGEPLRWHNANDTATPAPGMPPALSSEAIWTANGALCLDVPRREDDEPDIAAAIAAECGTTLPSCAAYLHDWRQYGEWLSENPD